MITQELEVYSSATNAAVVRAPGRRFPGVVVQGDTLATLCDSAQALVGGIDAHDNEDLALEALALEALALYEHLSGLLLHYEAVLRDNGISLPY